MVHGQTLDGQTLDRQTLDGQTLDRHTLDRHTLDRQTLDTTNPGHDKPWTRQTPDTTNPGHDRSYAKSKAVYTVTILFHILPDFLTLLHPNFSSFFTGYRNLWKEPS
jgi:hypothetical protein